MKGVYMFLLEYNVYCGDPAIWVAIASTIISAFALVVSICVAYKEKKETF